MRFIFALAVFVLSHSVRAGLVHQANDQDDGLFSRPKYFRQSATEPDSRTFRTDRLSGESDSDDRYSNRFAKGPLSEDERLNSSIGLVQSYITTMEDLGIQTWLMHQSLLGWWWGQHVLPWARGASFQVTEARMFFLASYYNMTTYRHWPEHFPEGRDYLLEINPHFLHRDQDDNLNTVDARWIDMVTGLYVEITAARYAKDHEQGDGILYEKNGYQFRDTYLYPLLQTTFEQTTALIPYRYEDLLRTEYGERALRDTTNRDYVFNKREKRWKKKAEAGTL